MKLGEKYGSSKLEKACEQILKYAKEPSIRILTAVECKTEMLSNEYVRVRIVISVCFYNIMVTCKS